MNQQRHCHYIHQTGTYCQSPPLRDQAFCYHHLQRAGRRMQFARGRAAGQPWRLDLTDLEDMHAVQTAIGELILAIDADRIDPRRAQIKLACLRQAARNLRCPEAWQHRPYEARDKSEQAVTDDLQFQLNFGLPKDLDLTQPPHVAFPPQSQVPKPLNSCHPERSEVAAGDRAQSKDPYMAGAPPLSASVADRACPERVEGVGATDARTGTPGVAGVVVTPTDIAVWRHMYEASKAIRQSAQDGAEKALPKLKYTDDVVSQFHKRVLELIAEGVHQVTPFDIEMWELYQTEGEAAMLERMRHHDYDQRRNEARRKTRAARQRFAAEAQARNTADLAARVFLERERELQRKKAQARASLVPSDGTGGNDQPETRNSKPETSADAPLIPSVGTTGNDQAVGTTPPAADKKPPHPTPAASKQELEVTIA